MLSNPARPGRSHGLLRTVRQMSASIPRWPNSQLVSVVMTVYTAGTQNTTRFEGATIPYRQQSYELSTPHAPHE